MHKACLFGDTKIVEMLIEATVQVYGQEMVESLLSTEDIEGNTPLLLAVESGSPEIARERDWTRRTTCIESESPSW